MSWSIRLCQSFCKLTWKPFLADTAPSSFTLSDSIWSSPPPPVSLLSSHCIPHLHSFPFATSDLLCPHSCLFFTSVSLLRLIRKISFSPKDDFFFFHLVHTSFSALNQLWPLINLFVFPQSTSACFQLTKHKACSSSCPSNLRSVVITCRILKKRTFKNTFLILILSRENISNQIQPQHFAHCKDDF